jgi:hypothetical protein
MAQLFGQLRNVDLSTAYYFETAFASGWTGVNIVKGYPNFPAVSLPCVAVRINSVNTDLLEIGSRQTDDLYNIIIDIFAKSDGQKLDLAQYVKNLILADWVYYEWSRGSGDTMNQVANGKIVYSGFTQDSPVFHGNDVDVSDKYRYIIAVDVRVAKNA